METFSRTKMLLGEENLQKLSTKKVIVFGAGGVGSYCIEALARCAIASIDVVDNDKVAQSNINRQLYALNSTLGKYKADVAKERILDINTKAKVEVYKLFYNKDNSNLFDFSKYDYVVDAIDSVSSKIELILNAKSANTPIISSMGTGNKLNPMMFEIADIYKTSICPLARVMRVELKKRGVKNLKVLYSKELPIKNLSRIPASYSCVPSVAGLIIASEVIKDLINIY